MKLSAPIHLLKSRAKDLKRSKSMTMVEALNEVARQEGFSSWSLLQSKAKGVIPKKSEDILTYLNPGDLMLIGARPGKGKTTFTLDLLLQAARNRRMCRFFSLEYSPKDISSKLGESEQQEDYLRFDFSDQISAAYIVETLTAAKDKSEIIAIDYLQLLDQKRTHPPIKDQIAELKAFAKASGTIMLFISQLDRSFDSEDERAP